MAARPRPWLFLALLICGSGATTAAAIVGNGSIVVAVAPVLIVAVLAIIWAAPIRITLFILVFLGLALDATGEGPWDSPVAPLGRLLTFNLNKTFHVDALAIPLMALVLGYLLIIHLHRRLSGLRSHESGRAGTAAPLRWALGLSFLTVIVLILQGSVHGADLQMAKNQVQSFVLLLLMAYLMAVSLRGMRDYRILGGLILAAACSKALMALWAVHKIPPLRSGGWATVHGDSMLFAGAATMLIAWLSELPVRRSAILCLAFLPLLLGAIVANNRRLAWVEMAATLGTLSIISRRTPLKRWLTRSVLLALPFVLAYIAVGWNSSSRIFAPVQVFRSVEDSDADADGSTEFRDLENYNLVYTLKNANLLLGTGFGRQFAESVSTPALPGFKEYRYMPHNSVLGLWCFAGLLGFTGLSVVLVTAVFFAARSYWWAQLPEERAVAFTALAMVLIYLIQCYGDLGFFEKRSIFLVGTALAVAGRLAVTTGAWGARLAHAPVTSRRR